MMISTEELLLALKYDDSEELTVEMFRQGAIAFLKNANMYHEDNDLTKVVLVILVGFWMDNREASYTDFKKIGDFPLGVQGLLNQLRYHEVV